MDIKEHSSHKTLKRSSLRSHSLCWGVVCVLIWLAGCFVDFTEAIPCESQGQCPTGFSCDINAEVCVSGDVEAVDAGSSSGFDGGGSSTGTSQTGTTSTTNSTGTSGTSTSGTTSFEGPCPEEMAFIESVGACVDLYEASRPDATEVSAGVSETFARSVSGVLPWTNVVPSTARIACERIGKRLCAQDEWTAACGGVDAREYPYSQDTFDRSLCNMTGSIRPTGSFSTCTHEEVGTFDMSGNVSELIEAPDNGVLILGGSYIDTVGVQVSCQNDPRSISPGRSVGFRCCRDPEEVSNE